MLYFACQTQWPAMENPKKKSPHHPHDKLFKAVFKHPNHARVLLEARLPEPLLHHLDLSTLRLADAARVDSNLKEDFSDVQLVCNSRKGTPVEIPLLLEHKSNKPPYPPFQFMHYQDGIWAMQIRTKGVNPTPIVPVLFYHGAEEWEPKPWKDYLEGWDEVFAPFTPPGGCIYISLTGMSDEEIKGFRYGFLVTSLLLMKHRLERDYLLENLVKIFTFVEADSKENSLDNRVENLEYALSYLRALENIIRWDEAKEKLQVLEMSYKFMTIHEEIKHEGFEEGLEKGLEKGREEGVEKEKFFSIRNMLRKNFDDETIMSVLDASKVYVDKVRKQLEKESQVAGLLKDGKLPITEIAQRLEVSPFLVEAVKKDLDKKKSA